MNKRRKIKKKIPGQTDLYSSESKIKKASKIKTEFTDDVSF